MPPKVACGVKEPWRRFGPGVAQPAKGRAPLEHEFPGLPPLAETLNGGTEICGKASGEPADGKDGRVGENDEQDNGPSDGGDAEEDAAGGRPRRTGEGANPLPGGDSGVAAAACGVPRLSHNLGLPPPRERRDTIRRAGVPWKHSPCRGGAFDGVPF